MKILTLPIQLKLIFPAFICAIFLIGCLDQSCPNPISICPENLSSDDNESDTCPSDELTCPDGYKIKRNVSNSCEFDPCPEIFECDVLKPCPEGAQCLKIPEELPESLSKSFANAYSGKAICYYGNPCNFCESGECNIMESYPMQIGCFDSNVSDSNASSKSEIRDSSDLDNSKEIVEIQIDTYDDNTTNITFISN